MKTLEGTSPNHLAPCWELCPGLETINRGTEGQGREGQGGAGKGKANLASSDTASRSWAAEARANPSAKGVLEGPEMNVGRAAVRGQLSGQRRN